MIAKNGDKVVVVKSGDYNGVNYYPGKRGVMIGKAHGMGVGGDVKFDSGEIAYLYKDEYAVVVGEDASQVLPTAMTAESLRNLFLEIEKEEEAISKKIDAFSEEKSKIEGELRVMGFMLCSPVIEEFMPVIDDSPEIDYNDWRNWKKGDMIECVNSDGWGSAFRSGGIYPVSDKTENGVWVESEVGDEYITQYLSDFKFHSPF